MWYQIKRRQKNYYRNTKNSKQIEISKKGYINIII